ncbi:hypothetical protein LLS1_28540 [Leifsonia sp. LS1]|uniref:DUF4127 family protein n=1 Tax=Leifsonia sp. LS1 TaxID=2828483 RepID=UPI001CFDB6D0|nr:DUF4127 family protein [Leifsonia sp. LS1]GIT81185.1 hypothetical protein LLS1_28540 [Leifsonia sp. LS1]
MRIALVPLDERPVNVDLPRQVAAIAGAELLLPPAEAMPDFRTPADVRALHGWLRDLAAASGPEQADRLVVCVDTLVHGGIIPARITTDSTTAALQRLDLLREIATIAPGLRITAASLIMRASDSYSAVEEPEYWSRYGRELHALGAALHHELEADVTGGEAAAGTPATAVPDDVRSDFERRRLRNHTINLAALALHEEGIVETLTLTADDTAPYSAGSAEQVWLRHWARALPHGRDVLMYPGADEVGAVLVARALASGVGVPVWRIACGEADGLARVPNFENAPLVDSLTRQIVASGGRVAEDGEHADMVVVAHAPDPARGDFFGSRPASDAVATEATVEAVRAALDTGAIVALADVRFSNGGDPELVDRLADEGLLLRLASYGGWNTAGNSIGGAVAQAAALWAGRALGTADEAALRAALLTRILDDRAYQSGTRLAMHGAEFGGSIGPVEPAAEAAAIARITRELRAYLERILPADESWSLDAVTLPWHRSFEIGVEVNAR